MRLALTVRLYETEEQLPGRPSGELCARSGGSPTGEVLAYQDGAGVWQYAATGPTARGRDKLAGREIVRVFVDDPANRNHERQRLARLRTRRAHAAPADTHVVDAADPRGNASR